MDTQAKLTSPFVHKNASLWVFGYGSLIWRPDFPFIKTCKASLTGYERSFCMWSVRYRGTLQEPGLVLALDENRKTRCDGLAFEVAPKDTDATIAYLREREQATNAYHEIDTQIALDMSAGLGSSVPVTTFVINRDTDKYTGKLSQSEQALVISYARGAGGTNTEYLFKTAKALRRHNIVDEKLFSLEEAVKTLLRNQTS